MRTSRAVFGERFCRSLIDDSAQWRTRQSTRPNLLRGDLHRRAGLVDGVLVEDDFAVTDHENQPPIQGFLVYFTANSLEIVPTNYERVVAQGALRHMVYVLDAMGALLDACQRLGLAKSVTWWR